MKNIDKIRQMNSEELVKFLREECHCSGCRICAGICHKTPCSDGMKQWLEQEVEE